MDNFRLTHGSKHSMPKGAILLNDESVLKIQENRIDEWKPATQTIFLKYSSLMAGAAAALTSGFISQYYQRRLKLKPTLGMFFFTLPAVVLPSINALVVHKKFITNDILLMKTRCTVCLDLRALGLQSFLGTAYPVIISTIGGFSLSTIYFTYPLPSVINEKVKLFKTWLDMTRPLSRRLYFMFAAQIVLAVFLTKMQVREYLVILNRQGSVK